jgi:Mn2+/Fe2+ NRAMP family transporter
LNNPLRDRVQALGPGVLYAATAVGASHLVQSTRAGASFGLGLVLLILLTFVAKYPAFRFGAQYANVTGQSLLFGYHGQGNWAVVVYVIIALGTMFAAVPAVTLVTAGLAISAFGVPFGTMTVSIVVVAVCAGILLLGRYHWLDRMVKGLMLALALATVAATLLVLPEIDWPAAAHLFPVGLEARDVFFVIALLGLMPSSVDISVWHSLWSVAKAEDDGRRPTLQRALDDFHVGYFGALVLAICFVLLGAGVMFGTGAQFEASAEGFATQLIGLYAQALGAWSAPLIGAVAVAVMFSTVLTGLDGYPRAAVSLLRLYATRTPTTSQERLTYAVVLLALIGGSLLLMQLFVTSLTLVVDFASTIIFLFAPVVAYLNHRVMMDSSMPAPGRPGTGLRLLSLAGMLCMLLFSGYFLYLRFLA